MPCYYVCFSRLVLGFFLFFSLAVYWSTDIALNCFLCGHKSFFFFPPEFSLLITSLVVKSEMKPQICYPQAPHPFHLFLDWLIVCKLWSSAQINHFLNSGELFKDSAHLKLLSGPFCFPTLWKWSMSLPFQIGIFITSKICEETYFTYCKISSWLSFL